ncbi:MAG TPA: DEAD/DEAH box helicase, partial [Candidatus Acidoferrales bacterium]|nr:DEAD/DEAH box helicase [Candidatus Acidoferrales bacterium]
MPILTLDSPVTALPGLKSTYATRLSRLGIRTLRDLLLELPFDWQDFGEPKPIAELRSGDQATVIGTLTSANARRARYKKINLAEATLEDEAGRSLKLVWFNQAWRAQQLPRGVKLIVAGQVNQSRFPPFLEMRNPEVQRVDDGARRPASRQIGGLMPKYHLTKGLTSRRMADWVAAALPLAGQLEEVLPDDLRRRHGLMPIAEAVLRGHQPETDEQWRQARQRMGFAELFELQAAFAVARRRLEVEPAAPISYRQEVIDRFKAGLGFELTNAQRRAIWEVFKDVQRGQPMNRLLNGDVGSGKTAVAAAAAAMAHAAGLQAVVMAPTEILARQHLRKFRAYLEATFPDLRVELLVSGLPAAERRRVRMAAASGHCALLVGTHALIEEDVELADLGLAVVDEQHRFGTRQRELLRQKGRGRPHFLAMTATPIPRTL